MKKIKKVELIRQLTNCYLQDAVKIAENGFDGVEINSSLRRELIKKKDELIRIADRMLLSSNDQNIPYVEELYQLAYELPFTGAKFNFSNKEKEE